MDYDNQVSVKAKLLHGLIFRLFFVSLTKYSRKNLVSAQKMQTYLDIVCFNFTLRGKNKFLLTENLKWLSSFDKNRTDTTYVLPEGIEGLESELEL